MKATPCKHCGAAFHASYEDGIIECRDNLEVEVERLRAALTTVRQWDMINPGTGPDGVSDAAWLRGVLDDALKGGSS